MARRCCADAVRVALILAACGSHGSKLDQQPPPVASSDPWATSLNKGSSDDKGFDFQGLLTKVKDSIEKPGFYEAPERSADYQADKPHWGVLKLDGELVEREAFSYRRSRDRAAGAR